MDSSMTGGNSHGESTAQLVPASAVAVESRRNHLPDTAKAYVPGDLTTQVEAVRNATAAPVLTRVRRLLFLWLRLYVFESKRGQDTRVNLAVPLPVPLVGAAFSSRISWAQAMKLVRLTGDADPDARRAGRYLESCMALELIRVEEEREEIGKTTLVVIGVD